MRLAAAVLSVIVAGGVWLPVVFGGPAPPAAPPAQYVCAAPPGIALHATNPQMQVDGQGQIFCATRAPSSIGGIVWTVNPDGTTRILLDPNPAQFFANGELFVASNGYLYYTTVPDPRSGAPAALTSVLVPEWDP